MKIQKNMREWIGNFFIMGVGGMCFCLLPAANAQILSRNLECRSYEVLTRDEAERASNELSLVAKIDVKSRTHAGVTKYWIKNVSNIQWSNFKTGNDQNTGEIIFRDSVSASNNVLTKGKIELIISAHSSVIFDRLIENWNNPEKSKNKWSNVVFEARYFVRNNYSGVGVLDKPSDVLEAHMNCVISAVPASEGIDLAVNELKLSFKEGRHFNFNLSDNFSGENTQDSMNAVKEVIWLSHGEDIPAWPNSLESDKEKFLNQFNWTENATEFASDQRSAGTLPLSVAAMKLFALSTESELVFQILEYLLAQGIEFGFDGWQQNGCAAPTEALLLLDRSRSSSLPRAWSIDLHPCRE